MSTISAGVCFSDAIRNKNNKKLKHTFHSSETSSPEVIGSIVVIGRSSDLSLFANAFPKRMFQWLGICLQLSGGTYSSGYCPGFSRRFPFHCTAPDGVMQNQSGAKIDYFFS